MCACFLQDSTGRTNRLTKEKASALRPNNVTTLPICWDPSGRVSPEQFDYLGGVFVFGHACMYVCNRQREARRGLQLLLSVRDFDALCLHVRAVYAWVKVVLVWWSASINENESRTRLDVVSLTTARRLRCLVPCRTYLTYFHPTVAHFHSCPTPAVRQSSRISTTGPQTHRRSRRVRERPAGVRLPAGRISRQVGGASLGRRRQWRRRRRRWRPRCGGIAVGCRSLVAVRADGGCRRRFSNSRNPSVFGRLRVSSRPVDCNKQRRRYFVGPVAEHETEAAAAAAAAAAVASEARARAADGGAVGVRVLGGVRARRRGHPALLVVVCRVSPVVLPSIVAARLIASCGFADFFLLQPFSVEAPRRRRDCSEFLDALCSVQ